MSEQDTTEKPPGKLLKVWRWFTLTTVTPEADPIRSLSSFVVAVSTAVLSFSTLRKLGLAIGFPEAASYLFPIGFDFAVLAFTRAWLHPGLSKSTRMTAAGMAIFTIAASVVGNSIEHVRSAPEHQPLWWTWTAIVFSALTPLVCGMVVHLAAMVGGDVRARKAEEERTANKQRARASVVPVAQQQPLQATGTDGIPGASVTAISGGRRERIRAVRDQLIAKGDTIAHGTRGLPLGEGTDHSYAQVDRLAGTTGYAKSVVPNLEKEEADGQGPQQG
jgi:hypothetical protein